MTKKTLGLAELEAQTALELPDREVMLVTVVINNVLNNLSIDVDVKNNNVALQICAVVEIINVDLFPGIEPLTCTIEQ